MYISTMDLVRCFWRTSTLKSVNEWGVTPASEESISAASYKWEKWLLM